MLEGPMPNMLHLEANNGCQELLLAYGPRTHWTHLGSQETPYIYQTDAYNDIYRPPFKRLDICSEFLENNISRQIESVSTILGQLPLSIQGWDDGDL